MKHKHLRADSFKVDEKGSFTAVFATLNVKDHDGDVIPNGAIDEGAKVRISAYNHSSWGGALPVGKGTIHEVDNELHVKGEFFQNTTIGKDTYETVKGLDDLTEWSFGFDVEESEKGMLDGEPINKLIKLKIFEVSPVLLGAGIGTRTLDVKHSGDSYTFEIDGETVTLSADEYRDAMKKYLEDSKVLDEPEPTTEFAQQIKTVQAAVEDVVKRAQDVQELRMQDGRDLSGDRKAQLTVLAQMMKAQAQALETIIDVPDVKTELLRNAFALQIMEEENGS